VPQAAPPARAWQNRMAMPARPHTSQVIPAVLGAAGAAVFGLWFQLFRRPLPKTSGRLRLRGLEAPVEVVRDRYGVPHIRARSTLDLAFTTGFCHAQDRLWQLEFFRRATAGRLSEFGGAETLRVDRLMRTLGLQRIALREAQTIPEGVRTRLDAYAAGINAAIETAGALPIEFQLARLEPEPWSVADLLSSAKLMTQGLSTNWEKELYRAQLVRHAGPEAAARLEPHYPRANPVVLTPGHAYGGREADLADQIARVKEAIGLTTQAAGSNNWVVSGERSVTGKPLLACDPHLSTTIPGLFYEADLFCDDYRVRGATLPHAPDPVFAQTRYLAWGFTNVMADTQDLFVERLNEDDPRLYEFKGEWRQAEVVREEIHVKGRSRPEVLDVTITHHGPIVNAVLGDPEVGPLALSWTALEHPCLTDAAHRMSRARSHEELLDAIGEHTAPPLNMLWADVDGNIGYRLVGRIPIRAGDCPDVPPPGWTGEFEWEGTVPQDELPSLVNPSEGFIVTANNRIVGDDYPHHITSEWLDGYRARRIEELLAERERHSLEDFARIQTDFFSFPGIETVHRLSRLHPSFQREIRAIERLKSWDGVLDADTVAGTIYQAFTLSFAHLIVAVAIREPELRERYLNKSVAGLIPVVSSPWRFHARLLELWDEGDPSWFASGSNPDGRAWDEVALEALSAALDGLEERFGRNPEGWRWGEVHGVTFSHPFADANPLFRRIFARHVETGGASETVVQNGYVPTEPFTGVWGPVYRMLADVSDPTRSRWLVSTGQSGQPGSRHYDELIDSWLNGKSNPSYWDERELRAAGRVSHLHLDPD
jgi:penicillin amidase